MTVLRSKRKEYIYVPYKEKKKLLEKFDTSYSSVADALLFRARSKLQRRIRMYTLNFLESTPINFNFR